MDGKEILTSLADQPVKVVVMRALRLGDLICATPALRSLRALLPQAHITLVGLPLARAFVSRCRALDEFVEFPGYPGIADQEVNPARTAAFFTHMQQQRYDLAIQLHGSGVFSNPFTVLLGARFTIGFTRPGETDLGLDFSILYPSGREVHRLLALMLAFGAPDTGDQPELAILPEDRTALLAHPMLGTIVQTQRSLIGIHPGAKVATRRWMPDRFAAAGDALIEKYDAEVVITGGKDEWAMCERVRKLMRHPAYNVAGQTSLGTLAALIKRLRLFISNDSGPAHVADAVGTPSIIIFGAADAGVWSSSDTRRHRSLSVSVACRPCYLSECPIGYTCLRSITFEDVISNAATLLDKRGPKMVQSR